jgi:hypothetical protein
MVTEHIVELLVDRDQNLIFAPLLTAKLKILAPFWAIFDNPTHQSSTLNWEKLVILDMIYEI